MRVLIINSVCGRQSTGRICSDIKKELVKSGHICVIAFGEKNSIYDKDDYHIGNEINRYFHALSSRLFDNAGFLSINPTKKLIRFIDRFNPDIIHLHNLHGYYLNIDILFTYLKTCGKRIVWTLHDCWSFTGHCTYFSQIGCEKWKTGCTECPQKKEYPKSFFIDKSQKNYFDKKRCFGYVSNLIIVTPSVWLAKLVKASFLSNYECHVINNGIDLETFKPLNSDLRERFNLVEKRLYLGVAAVWEKRKGLADFIELSKLLGDHEKIVLIGLSNKDIKKLPNNIVPISKTDNARQLAEWYATSDVFLNPTYEDNYPTVNLEAISCGTPVITYDTGGSPECLKKGQYGSVVKKGDFPSMLKKARRATKVLVEDDQDIKLFSIKNTIEKYIELYNKILIKGRVQK